MGKYLKTVSSLFLMAIFLIIVMACNEINPNSNDNQVNEEKNIENIIGSKDNTEQQFDIKRYLTSNEFTLNGNGRVNFNVFSSGDGSIMINGNGNTLEGTIVILNNSTFKVRNLVATGGNYDASNNSDSFGTFYVNSDGSISGTLMDGKGNSSSFIFIKI